MPLFSRFVTRTVLCATAILVQGGSFAMATSHLIFFGTYTRSTSRGIYAARLDDDTGALGTPELVAETPNPTWIAFSNDKKFLYAVHPSKAQVIGYRIDPSTLKLTALPQPASASEKAGAPCHLSIDATNRTLVAANYGDGFVAALPIKPDGSLGEPKVTPQTGKGPNPQRQEKPHVHSATISPDNRFVVVCDLGLDKIFTYALNAETATLTPATPPFVDAQACSGPRHFKFSADGRFGYNVTEMGATVVTYRYDAANGSLSPVQTLSTLPADYQAKWGAEVRLHPNGRFLYASNRGHDSVAVFSIDAFSGQLTLVEIVPTNGKVPRNFALSPNGKWLVCAHQDSGDVTVFKVDPQSGRLTPVPNSVNVAMGVCVQFYD